MTLTASAEPWQHYGGDAGGQKFSALRQINTGNVGQLTVAWQYRTGELDRHPPLHTAMAKVQVNPILLPAAAGGHLMICTPFGRVVALDPGQRAPSAGCTTPAHASAATPHPRTPRA